LLTIGLTKIFLQMGAKPKHSTAAIKIPQELGRCGDKGEILFKVNLVCTTDNLPLATKRLGTKGFQDIHQGMTGPLIDNAIQILRSHALQGLIKHPLTFYKSLAVTADRIAASFEYDLKDIRVSWQPADRELAAFLHINRGPHTDGTVMGVTDGKEEDWEDCDYGWFEYGTTMADFLQEDLKAAVDAAIPALMVTTA
jgi:hypothetical protein